jgi:hypothetical protein
VVQLIHDSGGIDKTTRGRAFLSRDCDWLIVQQRSKIQARVDCLLFERSEK